MKNKIDLLDAVKSQLHGDALDNSIRVRITGAMKKDIKSIGLNVSEICRPAIEKFILNYKKASK